jgi:hypothetical protein
MYYGSGSLRAPLIIRRGSHGKGEQLEPNRQRRLPWTDSSGKKINCFGDAAPLVMVLGGFWLDNTERLNFI